ncbi:MAG TPA: hypothetical protein VNC82_01500 [Candidatus Limnocylindria bacterium]|nr:hypothetical protein [Candidatus Limnocylindria bacterium]
MGTRLMPLIRLDHSAIALPRIADAPSVPVAVRGGAPRMSRASGAFRGPSSTHAGGGRTEILERLGADGFLMGSSRRTIPRGTKEAFRWMFSRPIPEAC